MDRIPYANNSYKPYKSFYAFSMNHKAPAFSQINSIFTTTKQ